MRPVFIRTNIVAPNLMREFQFITGMLAFAMAISVPALAQEGFPLDARVLQAETAQDVLFVEVRQAAKVLTGK